MNPYEVRTYWLSFGSHGIVVVDITKSQADEERARYEQMHDPVNGPWVAAATREAYRVCRCPYEYEVTTIELTGELARTMPRNRLVHKNELEQLGLSNGDYLNRKVL